MVWFDDILLDDLDEELTDNDRRKQTAKGKKK